MRALVYDPHAPANLRFDEVAEPSVTESQALIDVHAIGLNFGELHFIDQMRRPGEVPGWDSAGVVTQAAADGSGPPVGARVVGFSGEAGWAERRVVSTDNLVELPEFVEFDEAAALPVAGVTALQALRALGPVVGRRVLITGASGGVGRFAVQLAARAGAHVIAAVGSAPRGEGLTELGAAEVVVGLDAVTDPVFGVLDNVGGKLLAQAFSLVSDGGSVQSIGMASNEPTTIDFEAERRRGHRKRLEPFTVRAPFQADLAYLLTLVADGELDPQIGLRDSWDNIAAAAHALLDRKVAGKAVLQVD
ncbi:MULTISPECIES: zinc-binding dehydrogenase [Mycolicibacterium]|uniref:Alcohol dehydrogenase, zinc-binding protein n=1 Tax=Mycolicibacterium senegalense TaxID=1796 RepID=A0A378T1N9_9MYCO|nr:MULTISPECIES: zinc-binding dehydrogenase [Mycolicibacterium]MCV7338672.1 zinc-binding dehydrogenase [Mycolicibacterium senegalense]MDR7289621.1 NADPH:quinone reductase-like Zn-dependent oxidoreductase [Mycolicibacterium senegalense]QZA26444.1 zinc-binding dehydrogenase [Mycolicibacterium senegalense]CDP89070.1 zinc-binding oxidoreductase [Mycolicibacterium farcinogenes]STZ53793.1 alcohol dehydrogenase, zinc-binding protein [Mycolicibacterium senegalense]